jgi:hypothetical protein
VSDKSSKILDNKFVPMYNESKKKEGLIMSKERQYHEIDDSITIL